MNTQQVAYVGDGSMNIVERHKMTGLSSMLVEGQVRNLGIVKNFRDNALLAEFLPKDLSISWAHLDPGEQLDSHRHPVASLIIAIEGAGYSHGDTELRFQGGDALYVPAWNDHGFRGADAGLWALSIQFSDIAIFENEIDPLTSFEDTQAALPPLNERQILRVDRSTLTFPSTFKNQEELEQAMPCEVDFYWKKISGEERIEKSDANTKRLVVVCSEGGLMHNPAERKIAPGMAFLQEEHINFSSASNPVLWLLIIEVKG